MEVLTQEESISPFELPLQNHGLGSLSREKHSQDHTDDDMMDSFSFQSKDSELDTDGQGWQKSKSRKVKKSKKKHIVRATRTSSRIPRDGVSIAEKATKRAMNRDNISGISSTNPFIILNNASNDDLHSVMLDLDLECESVGELLDVFRLEEKARAALAETNYKNYLEALKNRMAHGMRKR